jgi:hypothetical protein
MAFLRHRALLRGIPALAIAAVLVLGFASAAMARADAVTDALATEHYYSSIGTTAAQPAGDRAALAAERYYSSYGTPATLQAAPVTAAPAASDAGGPSWTAAILAGILVALAAAGAGVLAGRSTSRPRRASA